MATVDGHFFNLDKESFLQVSELNDGPTGRMILDLSIEKRGMGRGFVNEDWFYCSILGDLNKSIRWLFN